MDCLIVSVSRRREGLGPCAAPFVRPEPQSQLPLLAQHSQAAPGAHGIVQKQIPENISPDRKESTDPVWIKSVP